MHNQVVKVTIKTIYHATWRCFPPVWFVKNVIMCMCLYKNITTLVVCRVDIVIIQHRTTSLYLKKWNIWFVSKVTFHILRTPVLSVLSSLSYNAIFQHLLDIIINLRVNWKICESKISFDCVQWELILKQTSKNMPLQNNIWY